MNSVVDVNPQNAVFGSLMDVLSGVVAPVASFLNIGTLLFVIIAGSIGVVVFRRLTRSGGQ